MPKPKTFRIFCSYSHSDEELLVQLKKHMAVLKRQGVIESWDDREITPGSLLDKTIQEELDRADLILLLVSPDFLASYYCYQVEMGKALERCQKGEAALIPIILRHCDWQNTELINFMALPKDGKPIMGSHWTDRDAALLDVVQGIRRKLQEMQGGDLKVAAAPGRPTASRLLVDSLSGSTIGLGYGRMDELDGKLCYVMADRDSNIDFQRPLPRDGILEVSVFPQVLPTEESLLLCDANRHDGMENFHVIINPTGQIRFGFKPNLNSFSSNVDWHYCTAGPIQPGKWVQLQAKWGWDGFSLLIDEVGQVRKEITYPLHHLSHRFGIGRVATLASRPAAEGVGFRDMTLYAIGPG